MGVNTLIRLPATCGLRNVANAIAILAGMKAVLHPDGILEVEGLTIQSMEGVPELVKITIYNSLEGVYLNIIYHYEPEGYVGVLLNPRSTVFWISIGRKLIDLFGGEMTYGDYDAEEIDYSKSHGTLEQNRPSDDEPWDNLQQRLLNLKPITEDNLKEAEEFASYSRDP